MKRISLAMAAIACLSAVQSDEPDQSDGLIIQSLPMSYGIKLKKPKKVEKRLIDSSTTTASKPSGEDADVAKADYVGDLRKLDQLSRVSTMSHEKVVNRPRATVSAGIASSGIPRPLPLEIQLAKRNKPTLSAQQSTRELKLEAKVDPNEPRRLLEPPVNEIRERSARVLSREIDTDVPALPPVPKSPVATPILSPSIKQNDSNYRDGPINFVNDGARIVEIPPSSNRAATNSLVVESMPVVIDDVLPKSTPELLKLTASPSTSTPKTDESVLIVDAGRSSSKVETPAADGETVELCEPCEPKKEAKPAEVEMKGNWNGKTLEFVSADKQIKARIGGRMQWDGVWIKADQRVQFGSTDPTGRLRNGSAFRRGRFHLDGQLTDQIEYRAHIEFFNTINDEPLFAGPNVDIPDGFLFNAVSPADLWVAFKDLPVFHNVKLGFQKPALGMEHMTSSRFLPFLERSFNQDAFYGPFNNGFSPGVAIYDVFADESGTWNIGVYRNIQNQFGFDFENEDVDVTGRLTKLLVFENDGEQLVHVGISGSHRVANNDVSRIRVRGSERPGPLTKWFVLLNTGNVPTWNSNMVNAEFAAVSGPFEIQADYLVDFVDAKKGASGAVLHGGYLQVLYFLTGEHRHYEKKEGVFGRVVPRHSFKWKRSKDGCETEFQPGAWQIGARYSYLSLDDGSFDAGVLHDYTLGLNWFVTPNLKFQWNYSLTDRDTNRGNNDGLVHGFGMRLAWDW